SYDLRRNVIQVQRLTDNIGVASKAPLPKPIAQNGYQVLPGSVFLRQERAPENGLLTQNVKKVQGHVGAQEPLGLSPACEIEVGIGESGQLFEAAVVVAVGNKMRMGQRKLFQLFYFGRLPQSHQASRIPVRQRPEQDGIYDTENGGVGANPQC